MRRKRSGMREFRAVQDLPDGIRVLEMLHRMSALP